MGTDVAVAFALALAGALYVRALVVLGRRRQHVPRLQQAAFWTGLAFIGAGLSSPIDRLSEDLLSAHMAQHLLLAELGAPLALVGMRSPVLLFMLPQAALKSVARRRRLRRGLAMLARPLVAIPLYVVVLYAWHLRFMFEGALRNDALHVIQHWSFVVISLLVWWSALEPNRRRLRGELWKIGHIFAARMGGMMLGMAFLFMRAPAYAGYYGDRARDHGLTPLTDQQTAGGMMLSLDAVIVVVALCFFFWRASEDDRLREHGGAAGPMAAP